MLLVNEEPERGFLSVIEVRSGDKRLAEVGCTDEDGELQAVGAVLPASKLKGNESTEDAARRLQDEDFGTEFSWVRWSDTIEKTKSARYTVTTSYLKQILANTPATAALTIGETWPRPLQPGGTRV